MRSLRSRKLRAVLFYSTGGKCAICGCDLTNWHADHKIPWKLRPVTNVHEMQPLCPACNLTKGAKMDMPVSNQVTAISQTLANEADTNLPQHVA